MPDDLTKRGSPDRSKIAMHEEHEVRYWTKHLGVSREELQKRWTRSATLPPRSGRSLESRKATPCRVRLGMCIPRKPRAGRSAP